MHTSERDVLVRREQCKDMVRQAEHQRMIAAAQVGQPRPRRTAAVARLAVRLGTVLIAVGSRLQGSPAETRSPGRLDEQPV